MEITDMADTHRRQQLRTVATKSVLDAQQEFALPPACTHGTGGVGVFANCFGRAGLHLGPFVVASDRSTTWQS